MECTAALLAPTAGNMCGLAVKRLCVSGVKLCSQFMLLILWVWLALMKRCNVTEQFVAHSTGPVLVVHVQQFCPRVVAAWMALLSDNFVVSRAWVTDCEFPSE